MNDQALASLQAIQYGLAYLDDITRTGKVLTGIASVRLQKSQWTEQHLSQRERDARKRRVEVFIFRETLGLTFQEIAHRFGFSDGRAHQVYHRAKREIEARKHWLATAASAGQPVDDSWEERLKRRAKQLAKAGSAQGAQAG